MKPHLRLDVCHNILSSDCCSLLCMNRRRPADESHNSCKAATTDEPQVHMDTLIKWNRVPSSLHNTVRARVRAALPHLIPRAGVGLARPLARRDCPSRATYLEVAICPRNDTFWN